MNDQLRDLFEELKIAYQECLDVKLATHDVVTKHSSLCLKVLLGLGEVPNLINNRVEQRVQETKGLEVFNKGFWADIDMIIALHDHLFEEFGYQDATIQKKETEIKRGE